MIEVTQAKLREAHFFYQKLVYERDREMQEAEAFRFYLSAFLSAGRSVTFALQKEEKEKYDAWFPTWWTTRLTEEDRTLCDFFKIQRNIAQKEGAAETSVDVEYIPVTQLRMSQGHPAYGIYWFGPPGMEPPKIGRQIHSFERDGNKTEVAETCGRYSAILERLVRDFVEAHP